MAEAVSSIAEEVVKRCWEAGAGDVHPWEAELFLRTSVNPQTGAFFVDEDMSNPESLIEVAVARLLVNDASSRCIRLQASYDFRFIGISNEFAAREAELDEMRGKVLYDMENAAAVTTPGEVRRPLSTAAVMSPSAALATSGGSALTAKYACVLRGICAVISSLRLDPAGKKFTSFGEGNKTSLSKREERDVLLALESVLPRVALKAFLSLTRPEREQQLDEISNVVLGISVNQIHRKPPPPPSRTRTATPMSDTVPRSLLDLSSLSVPQLGSSLDEVRKLSGKASDLCQQLSDVILYGELLAAECCTAEKLELLSLELMYARQISSYLIVLVDEMTAALDEVSSSIATCQQDIDQLSALLPDGAPDVPKEEVYPLFDHVGRLYKSALEHYVFFLSRVELFGVVKKTMNTYFPECPEAAARLVAAQQANIAPSTVFSSTAEELARHGDVDVTDEVGPARLIPPSDTKDFLHLSLDFQGYCVWCIARKNGLLVPGDPSLGVVQYKSRFCVFAHEAALEEFLACPESFFIGIRDACIPHPQLIHQLRLHEDFPKCSLLHLYQEGTQSAAPPTKLDACTMTPTHFVDSHIDRDYEFSEWRLRKKALHIADICNKRTTSCQTFVRHFTRQVETQVRPPRTQATNTSVDKGVNPVQRHTYIRGLRGAEPAKWGTFLRDAAAESRGEKSKKGKSIADPYVRGVKVVNLNIEL